MIILNILMSFSINIGALWLIYYYYSINLVNLSWIGYKSLRTEYYWNLINNIIHFRKEYYYIFMCVSIAFYPTTLEWFYNIIKGVVVNGILILLLYYLISLYNVLECYYNNYLVFSYYFYYFLCLMAFCNLSFHIHSMP